MPRTFDGTNDSLHTASGALSTMTWGSFAAVLKRNNTTYANVMTLHTSGGTSRGGMEIENAGDGNHLTYQYTGAFVLSTAITVVNADGWVLVAFTKPASGTQTCRCHKYVFSTGVWTHENSNGTATDFVAPGASSTMRFGEWEGVDDFGGDLAVAAAWSARGLSDLEVELLGVSLQGWYATNPTAMWVFDQAATTQSLEDLTGGGANQSALTGTTVSTNSLPGFTYGHPIVVPTITSITVVTGSATLSASASLTADAHLEIPAAAALTASASLAAVGVLGIPGSATLSASASLAADAHLEIPASASLVAGGTLVADALLEVAASPQLAADATLTAAAYDTATAGLAGDAALAADATVEARELLWQWYGYHVFPDFEARDIAYERIRDFVEATRNTLAWPDPNDFYGNGLTKIDEGHIGDHDGPGFTWSFVIPDDLIFEAQQLSGDIQDYALDGQSGTAWVEDWRG